MNRRGGLSKTGGPGINPTICMDMHMHIYIHRQIQ